MELSVLRSKTLLAAPIRPTATCGDQPDHEQREQRQDHAAEDHDHQDQDQPERRDPDDRLRLRRRVLRVECLCGRAGHPDRQVAAVDGGMRIGAEGLGGVDRVGVVGVLVLGDAHDRELDQLVLRRRLGDDAGEHGVDLAVELADDLLDLGRVGRRQLAAVGAVEDHQRADAGLLRERLRLQVGRTDRLVLRRQELRLVRCRAQLRRGQDDQDGDDDPADHDVPRMTCGQTDRMPRTPLEPSDPPLTPASAGHPLGRGGSVRPRSSAGSGCRAATAASAAPSSGRRGRSAW